MVLSMYCLRKKRYWGGLGRGGRSGARERERKEGVRRERVYMYYKWH